MKKQPKVQLTKEEYEEIIEDLLNNWYSEMKHSQRLSKYSDDIFESWQKCSDKWYESSQEILDKRRKSTNTWFTWCIIIIAFFTFLLIIKP